MRIDQTTFKRVPKKFKEGIKCEHCGSKWHETFNCPFNGGFPHIWYPDDESPLEKGDRLMKEMGFGGERKLD